MPLNRRSHDYAALKHWGRVLHDEELARAIIDRTLHHGEYMKLTGASYRLKGRKIDLDLPAISERPTATKGGDTKSEN
ncbi:ATP-binding protein [Acaryochloris sp. 'Moss Beach']|uniref:ATP-binding protein n=1 Tax=Acaryochloris sp. 'Moss Beach' TaxID=2740837 RepID=UPI001F1D82D0|nr:ATP-binding protein [Acaryochloris sp. 'Moss Beach']